MIRTRKILALLLAATILSLVVVTVFAQEATGLSTSTEAIETEGPEAPGAPTAIVEPSAEPGSGEASPTIEETPQAPEATATAGPSAEPGAGEASPTIEETPQAPEATATTGPSAEPGSGEASPTIEETPQAPEATATTEPSAEPGAGEASPTIEETPQAPEATATTEPSTEPDAGEASPAIEETPRAPEATATTEPSADPGAGEASPAIGETPQPSTTPTVVPDIEFKKPAYPLRAVVTADTLPLFAQPDEGSQIAASLYRGQIVTILAIASEWAMVDIEDGTQVYAHTKDLEIFGDGPSGGPTSSGRGAKPLTLFDFGIDPGTVKAASSKRATATMQKSASYLHPQTLVVSTDNENNAHSGAADGDLNNYLFAEDSPAPIEVRFDIETLPSRSAHLAIYAWDCDETNGSVPEYDAVYVNGTKVGVMTGQNDQWNTTLISVPVGALHVGANYVTVHIGARNLTTGEIFEYYPYTWALEVKWMQLLLDGGNDQSKPDEFKVELKNARLESLFVYCEAAVTIQSHVARSYEVEYSLVDNTSPDSGSYLQVISADASLVSGTSIQTTGTLNFPIDSPTGEYLLQVLLKDAATGEILAVDEVPFEFASGVVPSFDISDFTVTLNTEDETTSPVTMYLSAQVNDPANAITGVSFYVEGTMVPTTLSAGKVATASYQVTQNGTYLVEIRYVKNSVAYNAKLYQVIDNIRPAPTPTMTPTPTPSPTPTPTPTLTPAPTATPVQAAILSASLSPSSAKVGDKMKIVVVTSNKVASLSAINNTGATLNSAFARTANGNGTLTCTATYEAGAPNNNRYWTVTAYDAAGSALGTMKTNTVRIESASAAGEIIPLKCNGEDIKDSFAQINNIANLTAEISVSGIAETTILRYEITQNNTVLAYSTTGEFRISNSKFIKGVPVVAVMYTKDGGIFRKTLKIKVASQGIVNFSLPFLSGFTLKLPRTIDLLDGISFPFSESSSKSGGSSLAPNIDYGVDNTEVKIGLGLDAEWDTKKLNSGLNDWHYKQKHYVNKESFNFGYCGYIVLKFNESGIYSITNRIVLVAYCKLSRGINIFFLGVVPLDISLTVTAGGELEITNITYDWAKAKWTVPSVDLTLESTVTSQVGIGTHNISAGVYGKLGLTVGGSIYPAVKVKWAEVAGELGVYAKFKIGIIDYDGKYKFFPDNDDPIYRWDFASLDPGETSASAGEDPLLSLYNPSAYGSSSREYLAKRSAWQGTAAAAESQTAPSKAPPKSLAGYEVSSSGGSLDADTGYTVLQSSVYDGIEPQIVSAGSVTMMSYLDDDGDLTDSANFQHLVYSLWDGANGWSTPAQVDENDLNDADFTLFSDGKDIYAAYAEANRAFLAGDIPGETDSDAARIQKFSQIVGAMEIIVAKYDAVSGKFSRIGELTRDSLYDMTPKLMSLNGALTAVWATNADNDPFGATANNAIQAAVYDSAAGTWAKKTLLTPINTITSLAAGVMDGVGYAAAILDGDCDLATADDRTVALLGMDGVVRKLSTGINGSMTYAQVNGKGSFLWYSGSALHGISDAGEAQILIPTEESIPPKFSIVSHNGQDVILFAMPNSDGEYGGSDLYAYYAMNGGNPIRVTKAGGYMDAYAAFSSGGKLMLIFRRTDAKFVSHVLSLRSDLCFTNIGFGTNLALDDVYREYDFDSDPGHVTLHADIRNCGIEAVGKADILAGGRAVASGFETPLLPGQSAQIIFSYPLPADVTIPLQVMVSADQDMDQTNDTFQTSLDFTDYDVTARQNISGSQSFLEVLVKNKGTGSGPAVMNIHLDSPDGKLLYTEDLAIASGGQKEWRLSVSKDLMVKESSCVLYIEVVPGKAESSDYNNQTAVTIYNAGAAQDD